MHTYARKLHERACSTDVPYGILNTASKMWAKSHPDAWYGNTYMDANPRTWAMQQLGLGMTNAIVDHILRSDSRARDPSATSYYQARRRKFKRVMPVPIVGDHPPPPLTLPLAPSRRPLPRQHQNAFEASAPSRGADALASLMEESLLQNLGLST